MLTSTFSAGGESRISGTRPDSANLRATSMISTAIATQEPTKLLQMTSQKVTDVYAIAPCSGRARESPQNDIAAGGNDTDYRKRSTI